MEQAKFLLQTTTLFQDEVITRISDLSDESSIIAADLYCHKSCINGYKVKFKNNMDDKLVSKQPKKCDIFSKYITFIKTIFENGNDISLSKLRDMLNQNEEVVFNNSEIKLFITKFFGDSIQMCYSEQKNEPMFMYSSKIDIQDVIDKLRSLDGIKIAAQKLTKSLLSFDFELSDIFCDAGELKEAWENKSMPDEFLTFFAELFNIKKFSDDSDKEDDDKNIKQSKSEQLKILKIKSLFQIMYYNLHYGGQSTPFHIMNAHAIYEKCRSKEIITQQNRLGLSVSYNTTQKYRSNLAKHAMLKSSENNVPLPSHFSKEMFTVGAFDNFDHKDTTSLSGLSASHDTVSTLFQVKPSETSSNPNKSEYDLKNVDITEKLGSQTVKAYYKAAKCIELPDNFPVKNELYLCESELKKHKNKEFIINIIKSNFTRINMDVPTWTAMRSLMNEKPLPLMQVGFLPFVPAPVTDYATVYSSEPTALLVDFMFAIR